MKFLRRGPGVASLCAIAATATALLTPGVASAAKKVSGSVCSGVAVTGQGASIANNAEQAWVTAFSSTSDTNPFACSGTQGTKGTPAVTYLSTSSGKGLNSWGAGGSLVADPPGTDGFAATNSFLATEEPPTPTQTTAIENQETSPGSVTGTVLSIPVAQEAINIIVNLPAGCTANSTADPGRLVLDNTTLESIFNGTITNWSQITDDGDTVSGASCTNTTPIERIVRKDQAGTTHILKQYLDLINSSPLTTASGSETWAELSDGTLNTVWPTGSTTVVAAEKDSGVISAVASTPSSIGYASLSDVRTNTHFVPATGGPGTQSFWVPIQNNGVKAKGAKYADPASNGEVAAKATANCALTKYTNGVTKFPPANVDDDWSPVTTATKQKNYPLCGIIFAESLGKYSAFPGTSSGEVQTVQDFINYDLSTAAQGGQTLLNSLDYEALPKKLIKESVAGATEIGF